MGNAKHDDNYVPTLIAVSNADGATPVTLYADPTTHRLLVSATSGSLDDLSDVTITSAEQGDVLYYNGTAWVNLAHGTTGQFLKTGGHGANPSWDTPTAGAAGSDTHVQFNDGGSTMAGDAGFTYNKTTDIATLTGGLIIGNGGALKTTTTAGQTVLLQAYDNDSGPAYVTFGTLTAGNTPSFELDNTTLDTAIAKGTWTASGTWQIPAVTLGGTVTSNGQSFSGTIADIGTITTADINGGTIDGATIGATTRADISGLVVTANTGFVPAMNDGAYLGTTGSSFSDLFLAAGAVINFASGDVTVTHASNSLAFAGASSGYSFDAMISPASSDGAALGSGTLMWSDVFIANGGVINFNNNGYTLTHSTNLLTASGSTTVNDNVSVGQNLSVTGSTTVSGNATVSQNLTVTGTSTVASNIVAQNNVSVTGSTTVSGNLIVVGETTIKTSLTGVLRADSGVVGTDTDVTDLVSAATTSAAGKIEIAIASEVDTGTDATRAISPDALAGSTMGTRYVQVKVFDDATAVATGSAKVTFWVPPDLAGYNLVDADAGVSTVSSSGSVVVHVARVYGTSHILSVPITIAPNGTTSLVGATLPVINTANDDMTAGEPLAIDVENAGTGAKGLGVWLAFRLP